MSTRTERAVDKSQNERHLAILKDLVRQPQNKFCADCKKKDPRWASINLGVFICIRCSGIHRSIGTHITKVRSIDLDTWTPEQIQTVQRWGNVKANMYWEHSLPPNYEPNDKQIEQFIRNKYERKQFARPGPIPEPETLVPGENGAVSAPVATPAAVQAPVVQPAPQAQPQQPVANMFEAFSAAPVAPTPLPSTSGTMSINLPGMARQPSATAVPTNNWQAAFSAPVPAATTPAPAPAPPKDNKQAIMSLFNTSTTASSSAAPVASANAWGNSWGSTNATQPVAQAAPTHVSAPVAASPAPAAANATATNSFTWTGAAPAVNQASTSTPAAWAAGGWGGNNAWANNGNATVPVASPSPAVGAAVSSWNTASPVPVTTTSPSPSWNASTAATGNGGWGVPASAVAAPVATAPSPFLVGGAVWSAPAAPASQPAPSTHAWGGQATPVVPDAFAGLGNVRGNSPAPAAAANPWSAFGS